MKRNWFARHPIGFMALYFLLYLSAFNFLETQISMPRVLLVHCRLDDLIPFCKYAILPYFAWFAWIPFTLFYLLWKAPREDFWRLCLPLFGGMTIADPAHRAGPAPLLCAGHRSFCPCRSDAVPHRHPHQRVPVHPCVQLDDPDAGLPPLPPV